MAGHHLDYSLVESGLCMSVFISLWNESCVVGTSSAPLMRWLRPMRLFISLWNRSCVVRMSSAPGQCVSLLVCGTRAARLGCHLHHWYVEWQHQEKHPDGTVLVDWTLKNKLLNVPQSLLVCGTRAAWLGLVPIIGMFSSTSFLLSFPLPEIRWVLLFKTTVPVSFCTVRCLLLLFRYTVCFLSPFIYCVWTVMSPVLYGVCMWLMSRLLL